MFQFHPGNWPARKGRNCNFCGTRSDPTFVVMHFWGGADVFYNKSTASAARGLRFSVRLHDPISVGLGNVVTLFLRIHTHVFCIRPGVGRYSVCRALPLVLRPPFVLLMGKRHIRRK